MSQSTFEIYKPILDEYYRHLSVQRQFYLDMRSTTEKDSILQAADNYTKSMNQYTSLVEWCKQQPDPEQGVIDNVK